MNGAAEGASFTLFSHPRPRVDSYTAGDLTGGNIALYSTAHRKADRGSAILAANGPDRRVGGIGAFSLHVLHRENELSEPGSSR